MHTRISKANLLAPCIGLVVCMTIILFCADNAKSALQILFTGAFSSAYYFGTFLNVAAFLITAGTGSAIALKSGNMNLGGEGQIYAGGFFACLILTGVKGNPILVFLLACTVSILSGACLSLISACLKEAKGASVLLTSFLVSAATIPLIDSAITNSKQGPSQNLLALPYIPEAFRFKSILPPSPLTGTLFIALALSACTAYIMFKTNAGKKLIIWGLAPSFAEYSGFSKAANSFASLAVSGALHSLTGLFAVCGTYFTCHKGFYSGMGWNALTVALVAGANPLYIILSALVLSWLYTSADIVSLTQGFSFDIGGIVQGVVLFTIALSVLKRGESR